MSRVIAALILTIGLGGAIGSASIRIQDAIMESRGYVWQKSDPWYAANAKWVKP